MDTYIVAGYRTAVGKSGRGSLRFTRPDDLAANVIQHLMKMNPSITPQEIDDVIVGNATPEAEQGLNIGRLVSLMGLNSIDVPGMTVNRYCSSGLETIAIADSKIKNGMGNLIIAGGVETMSPVAMGGWRIVPNAKVAKENPSYYWGMGLTAEEVANKYNISREDQDQFAFESHEKSLKANENGTFKDDIVPIEVEQVYVNENGKRKTRSFTFSQDEGPRKGTSVEALARLRPVFAQGGSITAGNSSQTSDGAAFVMVASEDMVKRHNLKPIARMVSYATAGVDPSIMGIGPVKAIPLALKQAGLKLSDIDLIELNEAFASQSLAVIRELNLDPEKLNVNGGAISLGHPLGCTGAKLSVQIFNELKRRNKKYGMVTMCVGTGQGAAGIFEMLY
jgi:acetyl-CoA acyltransferase